MLMPDQHCYGRQRAKTRRRKVFPGHDALDAASATPDYTKGVADAGLSGCESPKDEDDLQIISLFLSFISSRLSAAIIYFTQF